MANTKGKKKSVYIKKKNSKYVANNLQKNNKKDKIVVTKEKNEKDSIVVLPERKNQKKKKNSSMKKQIRIVENSKNIHDKEENKGIIEDTVIDDYVIVDDEKKLDLETKNEEDSSHYVGKHLDTTHFKDRDLSKEEAIFNYHDDVLNDDDFLDQTRLLQDKEQYEIVSDEKEDFSKDIEKNNIDSSLLDEVDHNEDISKNIEENNIDSKQLDEDDFLDQGENEKEVINQSSSSDDSFFQTKDYQRTIIGKELTFIDGAEFSKKIKKKELEDTNLSQYRLKRLEKEMRSLYDKVNDVVEDVSYTDEIPNIQDKISDIELSDQKRPLPSSYKSSKVVVAFIIFLTILFLILLGLLIWLIIYVCTY